MSNIFGACTCSVLVNVEAFIAMRSLNISRYFNMHMSSRSFARARFVKPNMCEQYLNEYCDSYENKSRSLLECRMPLSRMFRVGPNVASELVGIYIILIMKDANATTLSPSVSKYI